MELSTVSAVEASAYTIPTDAPEADGTASWNATTLVLVRVRCGDHEGIGWTYGPVACAHAVEHELRSAVVGRDAFDVPGILEAMVRAVRNAGRPGVMGYAISAVDLALWDLKARLLNVSLSSLLGVALEGVPVYGSGGFTTYNAAQLREQLEGWVFKQQIPRVKMKIGESWGRAVDRDLHRMRIAREVIGDACELYVDANGAYGRKQAIRVMRDAADFNVVWFEEPVSSDDLIGLNEVRNAVDADVAAGEYGCTPVYFQNMCAAQAVDCLQADLTRCGGITEWVRIAGIAASHGLQISGHCSPQAHAHVAAATPNFRHLEYFHDHVRIERMAFDGVLEPLQGLLLPDRSRPGNGLEVREPDLAEYRVA